ncbi:sensor domain-containing diguanylate cyclase [Undibacterium sp. MH2W]|uniref:sensor domain-containing diguanylate cyclase n=1 Tax=Undibacterium sp. MH2W TaxID=3413044 RepID=UPI003BEFFB0E
MLKPPEGISVNSISDPSLNIDILPSAVLIIGEGCILDVNSVAIKMFEADSKAQLIGVMLNDLVFQLDYSLSPDSPDFALEQWCHAPAKIRVRTLKDTFRVLLVSAALKRVDGRNAMLLLALDMTELSTIEDSLRRSEMDFRRLFENMQDVYFRINNQGALTKISPAVKRMLGYEIVEVEKLMEKSFFPEENDSKLFVATSLVNGSVSNFPGVLRCKDGSFIDISINSQALYDDKGEFFGVEGIFRDVTHHKVMERELKRLASTDSLTGIDNRRAFLEHGLHIFKTSQRYQYPMSLLMLDLDFFKSINDKYGHATGDRVLVDFAAAVKCDMRQIDLFGRLGGEEFCLLLQQTNRRDAISVADRIRQRVQNMTLFEANAEPLNVTVSIGVAVIEDHDLTLENVIERADKALYKAKTSGRNCVVSLP